MVNISVSLKNKTLTLYPIGQCFKCLYCREHIHKFANLGHFGVNTNKIFLSNTEITIISNIRKKNIYMYIVYTYIYTNR